MPSNDDDFIGEPDEDMMRQCTIELNDPGPADPVMFRTCCNNKPLAVCRVSAGAIAPLIIFTVVLVLLYAKHRERIQKLNTLIYLTQLLIFLSYFSKNLIDFICTSPVPFLPRPDSLSVRCLRVQRSAPATHSVQLPRVPRLCGQLALPHSGTPIRAQRQLHSFISEAAKPVHGMVQPLLALIRGLLLRPGHSVDLHLLRSANPQPAEHSNICPQMHSARRCSLCGPTDPQTAQILLKVPLRTDSHSRKRLSLDKYR